MTAWRHKVCRGSGQSVVRNLQQRMCCVVCDRRAYGTRHAGVMPTHTTDRPEFRRLQPSAARADATGTP